MRRILFLLVVALALVGAVAACGGDPDSATTPAETTPAATSPAPSPEDSATAGTPDAAALFAENCTGCHKADGSGGFGPDLTGEDNAARVAEKIAAGGDGMTAFSGKLSEAQIQALADYVVSEL